MNDALGVPAAPGQDDAVTRQRTAAAGIAFARARLGATIPSGAAILDFGCGAGLQVYGLLEQGFDAWGADIYDAWNRPGHEPGLDPGLSPLPAFARARLRLIAQSDLKLPFPDRTFDFCVSEQVMEHVFDYETVFSEILRVLKPGALSLHRFPGPNYPFEGHVGLPLPWLCRSRAYLAACALAGLRAPDQRGLGWRATLARNVALMRLNNYPSKAYLRRVAGRVGAEIAFVEREEFVFRQGGRIGGIWRLMSGVGMAGPFAAACGLVLQRCMVLSRRRS